MTGPKSAAPDATETRMNLHLRLKNCLQTILDLEPEIERLDLGHVLLKEYAQLKSFIDKLGQVNLEEEDVNRIEAATENFLEELKTPLSFLDDEPAKRRLMQ